MIQHHIKIESAIVDGSNKVVRLLSGGGGKPTDKKALQEVSTMCLVFLCKVVARLYFLFFFLTQYSYFCKKTSAWSINLVFDLPVNIIYHLLVDV